MNRQTRRVTLRKVAGRSVGAIAYLFVCKPTKRERLKALRDEMYEATLASYAEAAADPEFLRDCEEIERAFAPTLLDGLPKERFAR